MHTGNKTCRGQQSGSIAPADIIANVGAAQKAQTRTTITDNARILGWDKALTNATSTHRLPRLSNE